MAEFSLFDLKAPSSPMRFMVPNNWIQASDASVVDKLRMHAESGVGVCLGALQNFEA